MGVLCLVLAIPDVIWSGIIAAILAFGGVILSNWINSKNIQRQLDHDALERDRERKASLRREVYLSAAAELTRAQAFLSALPQIDLTDKDQASGMSGFFAAAAKAQMVCEPKTSLLIGELVGAFGGLFFRLMTKAGPIHTLRSDIAIRSQHIDRYQGEVDRVLSGMTELNESGNPGPERMKALHQSFKFYQGQLTRINDERKEMFKKQNELNASYARDLFTELKQLLAIQLEAMAAIRAELNLGTDLSQASQQMEAQFKQMTAHIDSLISQLIPDHPA